eukprot:SAG31_NODE_1352_length_8668_cov_38.573229_8_plen_178_part_00
MALASSACCRSPTASLDRRAPNGRRQQLYQCQTTAHRPLCLPTPASSSSHRILELQQQALHRRAAFSTRRRSRSDRSLIIQAAPLNWRCSLRREVRKVSRPNATSPASSAPIQMQLDQLECTRTLLELTSRLETIHADFVAIQGLPPQITISVCAKVQSDSVPCAPLGWQRKRSWRL